MVAELTTLTVNEVMTSSLKVISPRDSMSHVNELLITHNIHHLPVVNDLGKLIGIVSRHDLDMLKVSSSKFGQESLFVKEKRILDTMLVEDIMSVKLTTLNANDSILKAVKIFNKNRLHAIPVLDDEILVGIITPYDLIKVAYS